MKKNKMDYPRWYGIRGIEFIWRGSWEDPYIRYKNYVMNSHDVEDAMWEEYQEYLEENGIKAFYTEGGTLNQHIEEDKKENERFSQYMKDNSYVVKELCQNVIDGGGAKRITPYSIRKIFAPFEYNGWVKTFDIA